VRAVVGGWLGGWEWSNDSGWVPVRSASFSHHRGRPRPGPCLSHPPPPQPASTSHTVQDAPTAYHSLSFSLSLSRAPWRRGAPPGRACNVRCYCGSPTISPAHHRTNLKGPKVGGGPWAPRGGPMWRAGGAPVAAGLAATRALFFDPYFWVPRDPPPRGTPDPPWVGVGRTPPGFKKKPGAGGLRQGLAPPHKRVVAQPHWGFDSTQSGCVLL